MDTAYGETRYTWGTTPTSYRYTGQPLEPSLNLYLMGARWYGPALARWLSPDSIVPDPANPQNLNRFSYVTGNPLRSVDPTGHFGKDEIQKLTGLDDEAFTLWWDGLPADLQTELGNAELGDIRNVRGQETYQRIMFNCAQVH